ncbi:MAG: hypothetical protein R2705_06235 [Ilumatobacteraceae bacterium]
MHEWPHGRWVCDTLPSEKYRIWTRANAGEVMPEPVSPMSATLSMGTAGEQGWRDAYVTGGTARRSEFEPDRMNCMGIFGGYLFLNMSLTRIFGVRCPGMTPELVDLQYFGDMPGIPSYESEARSTDVDEECSIRLGEWIQRALGVDDLPELRADRAQVDRRMQRPELSTLPDQELVDHARSYIPLYRRLFCRHIMVSSLTGVGLGMVGGVCAAIGKPELMMTLVSGLGDVDSAAPSWAMWDMGRVVASSASLSTAFDGGVEGLLDRIQELGAAGDESAAMFLGHWAAVRRPVR